MIINTELLQRCPVNAYDLSFKRTQNVAIFLSTGYMCYVIVNGVSQYCGTVDYGRDIVLQ